jgi:fructokinase
MTTSVLVAGESLVDLIVGPGGRIAAIPGGGPFNTARTIGRLGVPVSFLARISTDRFGREALDRLVADGVAVDMVVATNDPTTLALAELDAHGAATYRFYTQGTAAPGLAGGDVPARLPASVDAVHVGSLGLVLEPLAAALEILVERAGPEALVMVDPNCRPAATPDPRALVARVDRLLARADVVKVSADDLACLRPGLPSDAAVADLLARGPATVLLTDGPRDVAIVTDRGTVRLVPPRVDVVDTVGAGDAFGGGFLASWIGAGRTRADLADDDALGAAVRHGMVVASYTCTRAGAEPPTSLELADWAHAG